MNIDYGSSLCLCAGWVSKLPWNYLGMKSKLGENFLSLLCKDSGPYPLPPLSLRIHFHPQLVMTDYDWEDHLYPQAKVVWENCLTHLRSIASVFMSFSRHYHWNFISNYYLYYVYIVKIKFFTRFWLHPLWYTLNKNHWIEITWLWFWTGKFLLHEWKFIQRKSEAPVQWLKAHSLNKSFTRTWTWTRTILMDSMCETVGYFLF